MQPVFDALAVEVESRLPKFCRAARKTLTRKEAVS